MTQEQQGKSAEEIVGMAEQEARIEDLQRGVLCALRDIHRAAIYGPVYAVALDALMQGYEVGGTHGVSDRAARMAREAVARFESCGKGSVMP